jgi:prepilin-type N-terminal cleavage/methylation domain-containing protein
VSRGRQGGFTLVEMLVSLALTGVVMALTLPVANVQKRIWQRQEERREAGRAQTGALSWLTRDLQQAGYHDAGPPLRRLEPSAVAYVLSRDEDDPAAFSPANRRLVTVWLDGEELKYRIQAPLEPLSAEWDSGSTQVLAAGFRGLECRGLDARGEATGVASAARLVECTLTDAAGARQSALVRLRTAGRGATP